MVSLGAFVLLLSSAFASGATHGLGDTPNPVYAAASHMTKVRTGANGTLYKVEAPAATDLNVLHVYGDARERGLAQGRLAPALKPPSAPISSSSSACSVVKVNT